MNIISYLAPRFRTLLGKTIVHVGAHLGQEAEKYERWGAAQVIWIEAEPGAYARLCAHIETVRALPRPWFARLMLRPKCTHVCVQALVGDEAGKTATFHIFNNDGASNSIFSMHEESKKRFPLLAETGEVMHIEMERLDTLLERIGVSRTDVLVVDVQGAELLVLRGAERILKTAKYLAVEVSTTPFYQGGVLLSELEPWLEARGLKRRTRVRRTHMDAIFSR